MNDPTYKGELDTAIQAAGPTMPSVDEPQAVNDTAGFVDEVEVALKLVGTVLDGKYRLKRLIGQGGMGAVYEAEHTEIGSRVAVKVLFADKRRKRESLARFKREARAAGTIDHGNIAKVHDLGRTADDISYLVMEYVEGKSLAEIIAREKSIAPERVIELTCQVLDALGAAHSLGIVHRDIKPENVMVTHDGEGKETVRVLDFGISKVRPLDSETQGLTQTGTILGTPMYMAPEQARGEPDLDHRIDLYAVGAMMYVMLTGTCPFQASNYNALLAKILTEQPPPVDSVVEGLDKHLARVVEKAMARDRRDRFTSSQEFIDALRGGPVSLPLTLAEPPSQTEPPARGASRTGLWVGLGLVVLLGGGLVAAVGSGLLSPAGAGGEPVVVESSVARAGSDGGLSVATQTKLADLGPREAAPDAAASPTMIKVALTTDPPEARVTINGGPRENPVEVEFVRTTEEQLHVIVEAEGYETKELFLPRTEDVVEKIVLKRRARHPVLGGRPGKKGGHFKMDID